MDTAVLLFRDRKAKKKEAEAENSNSSESEDDSYQPPISEHVDDNDENVEDSEKNMIQTDVAVYADPPQKKILKTRMSSLNRSNIMMNLLTVTGKMRQKNFLTEKLKMLIMMWFLLY
ncbi:hypothetical protein CHS0354_025333 [Potamilus streckersoni]|uniref:Uncharacterized protein n=1 Tax=Potamilus streckersoni TaxID=2493646 RepID=A0AAE0VZB5_9BIVA|nr:hypothetical protein CHS0354_025333 [Potamilus streckersoni]